MKLRLVFLLWVFPLCAAAVLRAAPIKVACVGDSITEGAGISNPAVEGYPARLQRLLGTNYTVRNYGVSGRTLLRKGDFPYWVEGAFRQSTNFGPDIVIIQLGTNDSKPQNWRHGTNYLSDYKDLIAVYQSLASQPRVFLCTPCQVYASGAFQISPGVVATNIAPQVRELSTELQLPLIDLHVRLANHANWFPDTVHPDSKGATAMAAVMYEAVGQPLPGEGQAPVRVERIGGNRFVLSWPAEWGGMMPESAPRLLGSKTAWSVQQTPPGYSDGTVIRQTNTLTGTGRYYRLSRP